LGRARTHRRQSAIAENADQWLSRLIAGGEKVQAAAVLLLERLCAAQPLQPSDALLAALALALKPGADNDRAALSALESMCAVSFAARAKVRDFQGGALLKVARRAGAVRLLRVLGEDPAPKPAAVVNAAAAATTSASAAAGSAAEKRPQDLAEPPKPASRGMPTFTSFEPRASLGPPRGPPPPLPPAASPRPGTSQQASPQTWACPACTFVNPGGSAKCDMCDAARPPARPSSGSPASSNNASSSVGAAKNAGESVVVTCKGCGVNLRGPASAPTVSCPKCFEITPTNAGFVRVRCAQCMTELLAPDSAKNFKCSTCGGIGDTRERRVV
jgi:hypothetical protein